MGSNKLKMGFYQLKIEIFVDGSMAMRDEHP